MTKTEWKPTKEMLDLIWVTSGFHPLGSHAESAVAALIAVQPDIAAEALEKVAQAFYRRGDKYTWGSAHWGQERRNAEFVRAMIEKEPQG